MATTVQLQEELFREIKPWLDSEAILRKIIASVRELVSVPSRGVFYTKLLEKLSDYQEYEYDWDGDGALPLNAQAVKNFKAILKQCDDDSLANWSIFPSANGTLLFQYNKKKSGINIGKGDFSYYEIADGNVKGENSLPFSPEKVVECMKKISK